MSEEYTTEEIAFALMNKILETPLEPEHRLHAIINMKNICSKILRDATVSEEEYSEYMLAHLEIIRRTRKGWSIGEDLILLASNLDSYYVGLSSKNSTERMNSFNYVNTLSNHLDEALNNWVMNLHLKLLRPLPDLSNLEQE